MRKITKRKVGRPALPKKRVVSAIAISKSCRIKLKQLATNESRSMANYLELLIDREHSLTYPKNAKMLGKLGT